MKGIDFVYVIRQAATRNTDTRDQEVGCRYRDKCESFEDGQLQESPVRVWPT
jgi:hypothetical protein